MRDKILSGVSIDINNYIHSQAQLYNPFITEAISSILPASTTLTKGVSIKQKIYKPITQTEIIASAQSPFGKIDGWSKQRLLKKEGVIYDLLN